MTALYIVLGIILLVTGILNIPVGAVASYNDDFSLYIKYLFFKIKILPEDEKKEKKQNKPKKQKKPKKDGEDKAVKEKNKNKKDNIFLKFYHDRGFSGTLELIKDAAGLLKDYTKSIFLKHFVIKEFRLNMTVAGEDSADTAVKFAKISSGVYISLGFIKSKMKFKNSLINIQPDFIGDKSKASFYIEMRVRPAGLINATLYLAMRLLKRLLKVMASNSKNDKLKEKSVSKYLKKAKENGQ